MEDENAFGILVAFSTLEDEEYGSDDLTGFVDRFTLFSRLIWQYLDAHPIAPRVRGLNLGHAVYLEFADDEASLPLLSWVKGLRQELSESEFTTTVVASHGGRWLPTTGEALDESRGGDHAQFVGFAGPSEPLRRALYAETRTYPTGDADEGWGPGFYLDIEAMEALGVRPKNEPTYLDVASARFVRVNR